MSSAETPQPPQSPEPQENLPESGLAETYKPVDLAGFKQRMQELCDTSIAEHDSGKYNTKELIRRRIRGFQKVKDEVGIGDDSAVKVIMPTAKISNVPKDVADGLPANLRIIGNITSFIRKPTDNVTDTGWPKVETAIQFTGIADTYNEPMFIRAWVRTDDINGLEVLE